MKLRYFVLDAMGRLRKVRHRAHRALLAGKLIPAHLRTGGERGGYSARATS